MKKIIMIMVAICLVSAMAMANGKAESGKNTIKILAGQSTTDAGIEDLITQAVAAKYPELTLEWECVGWGTDLNAKVQMYMQSGLPDIIVGKVQDVANYGPQGILADLSKQAYMSGVLDAAKNGVTIDGKLMGLTYNALYQGVYYNRELFKKYGIQVPTTLAELDAIVKKFKSAGIFPFGTHMVDTWSIGNITMQFAVNELFRNVPDWGDQFRAGKVNFSTSPEYKACYEYNKYIYDNTWSSETFSTEQTACDARMVRGEAAMKVSGSWSIQNFIDIDPGFDFGVFPFPNRAGDAKLLFEPNITFMATTGSYADPEKKAAIDKIFEILANDKQLGAAVCDFTKTASMLKDCSPTFTNPSQSDIDRYSAAGMIQDVNVGNNQLQWGGFQEENAKDIAEYVQGNISLADALAAADARRAASKSK